MTDRQPTPHTCDTCDDAETILVCCGRQDLNDGWCCEFFDRVPCPDCQEEAA